MSYQEDNKSFVVYKEWEEIFKALDDADKVKLLLALFAFASRGEQPDFKGPLQAVFLSMAQTIKRDGEKWEKTREKRAAGGFKGGAPKGNQNAKKQPKGCLNNQNNLKPQKQPVNVNENVKVNVNDNVNVNVKEENVSPSADDFSAVELSDEQLNSLVSFSSRPLVDYYISKARDWQIKHKRKYKDAYKTIKGWLESDKAKNPTGDDKQQSFSVEQLEKLSQNFMQRYSNTVGGESSE
jgi:hypothetical protein